MITTQDEAKTRTQSQYAAWRWRSLGAEQQIEIRSKRKTPVEPRRAKQQKKSSSPNNLSE